MAVRENLIACFRLHQPCQLTCLLVSQPISSLSTTLKCLLFCLPSKSWKSSATLLAPPAGGHSPFLYYIGVVGLFGVVWVCKLVGLIYKINTNKVIQKTEFLRIYGVACRIFEKSKYFNFMPYCYSLFKYLLSFIFYLLSFIFYLLSFIFYL